MICNFSDDGEIADYVVLWIIVSVAFVVLTNPALTVLIRQTDRLTDSMRIHDLSVMNFSSKVSFTSLYTK